MSSKNKKPKLVNQKHRGREFVLQALFQWSINPLPVDELCTQFLDNYDFTGVDIKFFMSLLQGSVASVPEADELIAVAITRPLESVNKLVKSILRLAIYELKYCPDVPYKVVINEAIELQKSYGADEGRAFVNAVLDKLAPQLRPLECK
jgi:N utilization substance protein B